VGYNKYKIYLITLVLKKYLKKFISKNGDWGLGIGD